MVTLNVIGNCFLLSAIHILSFKKFKSVVQLDLFGPIRIPTHKSQEMIKNEHNFFNPNSIETDGGEIEMHLNFTSLSAELHILSV